MTRTWKRHLSTLFAILIAVSAPTFAQTFHGTISGTVVDVQGAVVAGAAVQLVNPGTNFVQNSKSSSAGEFLFTELPVGLYELTVTAQGFETYKVNKVAVEVSKVTNIKAQLSIGAENTVIDVAANAVQTDTTSAALVAVIDSKSVQEMPMNGRNFTQMTHYAPGASALTNSVNGYAPPASTTSLTAPTTWIRGLASLLPTKAVLQVLRAA